MDGQRGIGWEQTIERPARTSCAVVGIWSGIVLPAAALVIVAIAGLVVIVVRALIAISAFVTTWRGCFVA